MATKWSDEQGGDEYASTKPVTSLPLEPKNGQGGDAARHSLSRENAETRSVFLSTKCPYRPFWDTCRCCFEMVLANMRGGEMEGRLSLRILPVTVTREGAAHMDKAVAGVP